MAVRIRCPSLGREDGNPGAGPGSLWRIGGAAVDGPDAVHVADVRAEDPGRGIRVLGQADDGLGQGVDPPEQGLSGVPPASDAPSTRRDALRSDPRWPRSRVAPPSSSATVQSWGSYSRLKARSRLSQVVPAVIAGAVSGPLTGTRDGGADPGVAHRQVARVGGGPEQARPSTHGGASGGGVSTWTSAAVPRPMTTMITRKRPIEVPRRAGGRARPAAAHWAARHGEPSASGPSPPGSGVGLGVRFGARLGRVGGTGGDPRQRSQGDPAARRRTCGGASARRIPGR